MKIFRSSVPKGRVLAIDEFYPDWDASLFEKSYPLLGMKDASIRGNFENVDDILTFNGVIEGTLILADSRSNEPFEEDYSVKDVFQLLEDEDEDCSSSAYVFPENGIDLEEFVLSVLRSEVPIKPLKPGSEERPEAGDRDFLLEEEQAEEKTSPFDVLLDLDLDE